MTGYRRAYVGMQCFWGVESSFAKIDGVMRTRVGYAGGTTQSPTYKNIGDHTEITEVQFDEKVVSYERLLDWFWEHHNPTERHKKQYQSAILYIDDEQKRIAEQSLKHIQEKYGNQKVETYVKKLDQFYQAEDYHQKYWLRCQSAVLSKLNLNDQQVVESTLAAKVNAFLAGYDNFDVLKNLAAQHHLSDDVTKLIEEIARSGGDPRACH
ncbi:Peptide methionine sulfoxide reductase [Toxocara canis]|uniref:peptide-methionine (S)-S-oxide reductase n=1 Tax=Toxocara canis TaxID=6265 RepID=A0A0B2VN48_TOXCA|nr:Peptide methionine sulfoxide reductase [Toxocara canis]